MNTLNSSVLKLLGSLLTTCLLCTPALAVSPLTHDAEYYILEKQNSVRWAQEDKNLDRRLAEFRKKNGGKSPNIFYILIDDIGFGDLPPFFLRNSASRLSRSLSSIDQRSPFCFSRT